MPLANSGEVSGLGDACDEALTFVKLRRIRRRKPILLWRIELDVVASAGVPLECAEPFRAGNANTGAPPHQSAWLRASDPLRTTNDVPIFQACPPSVAFGEAA